MVKATINDEIKKVRKSFLIKIHCKGKWGKTTIATIAKIVKLKFIIRIGVTTPIT